MIYCFDIDGVMADKTSVQHLDCTKSAQREEFEKAVPGLPVRRNFFELVNKLGRVCFLTSRTENLRGRTNKWLLDNGVMAEYELFMRPEGNNDTCRVLKLAMLEVILQEEKQNIMFFDDNPFTCLTVEKKLGNKGVSVCEVL